MKYSILALVLLTIGLNISCIRNSSISENKSTKYWFKGNLHTHSYWSDGDEFPEVIMDWYKSNGYQFVALSDHNTLAEGDRWITIAEDSLYQNSFRNYLNNYGSDWVNYRIDSGRIHVKLKTYLEYKDRITQGGKFLIIQSEEITELFEKKPLHLNVTNIKEKITPQGGNSVSEVLQNNINEVINQRNETGIPMIPHINHPNFGYGISLNDMISLKGERFFEVYNGHPLVHNLGDSLHLSTLQMWDLINISYIENNKPLMYGLATDDSHHYHVKGSKWSNAGRGWIMVQADSLTAPSLISAMESGQFYATTGVILKELEFDQNRLSVEVVQEEGITYGISFIGNKKGQSNTEELKFVNGSKADFELTDDIIFVRCQITSSKLQSNPIENMLYEKAWIQPILSNH